MSCSDISCSDICWKSPFFVPHEPPYAAFFVTSARWNDSPIQKWMSLWFSEQVLCLAEIFWRLKRGEEMFVRFS